MALEAGFLSVTVEFAQHIKDADWFGRQDPYCIIRVGGQTFRTRTAVDGGRNPVWNETFSFELVNENDMELNLMEEKLMGRDASLGSATVSLARARQAGSDRIQAPVISPHHHKQHGIVSLLLQWQRNGGWQQQLEQQQAASAPPLPQEYQQQLQLQLQQQQLQLPQFANTYGGQQPAVGAQQQPSQQFPAQPTYNAGYGQAAPMQPVPMQAAPMQAPSCQPYLPQALPYPGLYDRTYPCYDYPPHHPHHHRHHHHHSGRMVEVIEVVEVLPF
ncbi:hypothetical protein HYH02_006578 [Chlamydomonas schloesseri]|uniref:C2 domain-containing protein n=1 Tax=Chlamydomonas schloesseri TaxID=2026947 RepID=A0A835THW9_9CHLO|nr:hypothetical protein HYH02_006578 [Chlamydomonas schloesseri]|eukprot:KAG2439050.1 hypothetical protein HYH02_006578 [Chlamydomonas schloesseri]